MNEANFEQKPFGDVGFAENPENRCPVILVLDNSGSMGGAPIQQLNDGLQVFRDELFADSLASKRVEVAIVSFGPVVVQTDVTTVETFFPPTLSTAHDTPMGAAVEKAIELLAERKLADRCIRGVGGSSHCFATARDPLLWKLCFLIEGQHNSAGEISQSAERRRSC